MGRPILETDSSSFFSYQTTLNPSTTVTRKQFQLQLWLAAILPAYPDGARTTGLPFPNNKIPTARIDPVAKNVAGIGQPRTSRGMSTTSTLPGCRI